MTQGGYGRALSVLTQFGLKPAKARAGVRAFEGDLKTSTGEVPVRFEIEDWNFLRYPRITLLKRPAGTPKLLEHVDALGGLCYLAPGSVVLDCWRAAKFDPRFSSKFDPPRDGVKRYCGVDNSSFSASLEPFRRAGLAFAELVLKRHDSLPVSTMWQ